MATHTQYWVQFTFNTQPGVWSRDVRKPLASWAAVCLTNASLWRRPVPRSFSINFIQSPPNGLVYLRALTEVRLWYFTFSRHTLWERNNLTPALGSHLCWPCVWGKAVVSTWSAAQQRKTWQWRRLMSPAHSGSRTSACPCIFATPAALSCEGNGFCILWAAQTERTAGTWTHRSPSEQLWPCQRPYGCGQCCHSGR